MAQLGELLNRVDIDTAREALFEFSQLPDDEAEAALAAARQAVKFNGNPAHWQHQQVALGMMEAMMGVSRKRRRWIGERLFASGSIIGGRVAGKPGATGLLQ